MGQQFLSGINLSSTFSVDCDKGAGKAAWRKCVGILAGNINITDIINSVNHSFDIAMCCIDIQYYVNMLTI